MKDSLFITLRYFIALTILVFSTSIGAARADQPATSCVQNQLKLLGFYEGEIDGQFGNRTKTAIEDYQKYVIQSDRMRNIGFISSSSISESLADSSEDLLTYWCNQIAARYLETINHLISYNDSFGSGVVIVKSATFSPVVSGDMYNVSVGYSVFGLPDIEIIDLCILVEAGEFYCYEVVNESGPNFKRALPEIGTEKNSVDMILNNSNLSFDVDVQLNYVSGGRKSTSNFFMAVTKDCDLEACESE